MSFDKIQRTNQNINMLTRSLVGKPAFEEVNVTLPDPNYPELGFIRATSWLYCLYFEGGRINLSYIQELCDVYGVDRTALKDHIENVRCLRTELHHNLGFESSDQNARVRVDAWRKQACGTVLPQTEEQWSACYQNLMDEANEFLVKIEVLLRKLEQDQDPIEKINEWKRRLDRSWPAFEFDPLIEDVKCILGREQLKTVSFRNKNLGRWRQCLDLLSDGADFDREKILLIEKSILDDSNKVLPVTGRDIIDEFKIEAGPQVGIFLEKAKEAYEAGLTDKAEIFDYLRKELIES